MRNLIIVSLIIILLLINGCVDSSKQITQEVTIDNIHTLKSFGNGENGLYKLDKELFRGCFDSVKIVYDTIWQHYIAFDGDTIYGTYDESGKSLIDNSYKIINMQDLNWLNDYTKDKEPHYMITSSSNLNGILSISKGIILDPIYKRINTNTYLTKMDETTDVVVYSSIYYEAHLTDGKLGLFDNNGEQIIPFGDYSSIDSFFQKRQKKESMNSTYVYGKFGEMLAFMVSKTDSTTSEEKYGIIGLNGKLEVPIAYKSFEAVFDKDVFAAEAYKYWIVEDYDGTKGLYNRNALTIIPPGIFSEISYNKSMSYDIISTHGTEDDTFMGSYEIDEDVTLVQLFDSIGTPLSPLVKAKLIAKLEDDIYILTPITEAMRKNLEKKKVDLSPVERYELVSNFVSNWYDRDGWKILDTIEHSNICYENIEDYFSSSYSEENNFVHGTYTISGQGYQTLLNQWTDSNFGDRTVEIKFYENYIEVDGVSYDLTSTNRNGVRRFSDGIGEYIVSRNYSMYYEIPDNFSGGTMRYDMTLEGDLQEPYYKNNDSHNSYDNQLPSDSNERWKSHYIENYRRREKVIQSQIESLRILQSDNNPTGNTYGAINNIKNQIRNSQQELQRIRDEASQKGIYITQSSYERMDI